MFRVEPARRSAARAKDIRLWSDPLGEREDLAFVQEGKAAAK